MAFTIRINIMHHQARRAAAWVKLVQLLGHVQSCMQLAGCQRSHHLVRGLVMFWSYRNSLIRQADTRMAIDQVELASKVQHDKTFGRDQNFSFNLYHTPAHLENTCNEQPQLTKQFKATRRRQQELPGVPTTSCKRLLFSFFEKHNYASQKGKISTLTSTRSTSIQKLL